MIEEVIFFILKGVPGVALEREGGFEGCPRAVSLRLKPLFNNGLLLSFSRLPMTRWVKLSLNFELLVNRVMKFLLGQRLFNNNIFFVQLELFCIQETTMLQNKIK